MPAAIPPRAFEIPAVPGREQAGIAAGSTGMHTLSGQSDAAYYGASLLAWNHAHHAPSKRIWTRPLSPNTRSKKRVQGDLWALRAPLRGEGDPVH
jgi:hypothetical protein